MTWNKLKPIALLGVTGMLLLGSVLGVSAAEVGSEPSDADVEFKAGEIIDPPIDPPDGGGEEIPEPPYPPIGTKSLQLVHTPALDFGEVQVTTESKDYYAKAQFMKNTAGKSDRYVVNYMKVIDVRGNNQGWNVKVKMDGAFKTTASNAVTPQLDGASITFGGGVIQTESSAAASTVNGHGANAEISGDSGEIMIMQAPEKAGAGIWYQEFGTNAGLLSANADGETFQENGMDLLFNPNIKLNIPAGVMPDSVKYSTTLQWVLFDTP